MHTVLSVRGEKETSAEILIQMVKADESTTGVVSPDVVQEDDKSRRS